MILDSETLLIIEWVAAALGVDQHRPADLPQHVELPVRHRDGRALHLRVLREAALCRSRAAGVLHPRAAVGLVAVGGGGEETGCRCAGSTGSSAAVWLTVTAAVSLNLGWVDAPLHQRRDALRRCAHRRGQHRRANPARVPPDRKLDPVDRIDVAAIVLYIDRGLYPTAGLYGGVPGAVADRPQANGSRPSSAPSGRSRRDPRLLPRCGKHRQDRRWRSKLGAELGCPVVAEYGRTYAEAHGTDFAMADLLAIAARAGPADARGAAARSAAAAARHRSADDRGLGARCCSARCPTRCSPTRRPSYYLLFAPDVPWVEDGTALLRHATERAASPRSPKTCWCAAGVPYRGSAATGPSASGRRVAAIDERWSSSAPGNGRSASASLAQARASSASAVPLVIAPRPQARVCISVCEQSLPMVAVCQSSTAGHFAARDRRKRARLMASHVGTASALSSAAISVRSRRTLRRLAPRLHRRLEVGAQPLLERRGAHAASR